MSSTLDRDTARATTTVRTPRKPRRVRTMTFDDWASYIGALVASLALVGVLYLHVFAFSGLLGFLVCWFATFLALLAGLVAMSNPRPIVFERVLAAVLWVGAAIVVTALGSAVIYTFAQGWRALVHINFYTHDMAAVSPTAPLNRGGIYHAIIGTLIEIGIAVAISVPLGIGTALYMSEVDSRLSRTVRTVVEAMTALPEILAGLFVYVLLIVGFGLPKSGLAAAVAISVTMVPIIARAGEVALRLVPRGLREASEALGAGHAKTIMRVVLPSARAGLVTATILAISRGIGETAIVLITSGASSFVNYSPTTDPMNSLPLFVYTAFTTHEPNAIVRAFGAASVLLILVLGLFVTARAVSRDRRAR